VPRPVPAPLDGDDCEDPDDVRWVLLLSVDGPDGPDVVYRVGSFDGAHLDVGPPRSLDAGPDVHAAATWTDAPDGRRVLLGWMADPDDADSTPTAPWRGAMTLPRELSLHTVDGSPTLRQRVPEVTGGLEVHLDRCSVEVFAGGTSSTHLVFPTEPYRTVTGTAGFHVLVPTPQEETP
jgi:sucrose-6-phosphate hydrolase SacC (GH32 family)